MFDLSNVKIDGVKIFKDFITIWKRALSALTSMPLAASQTLFFLVITKLLYSYFWAMVKNSGVLQSQGVAIYLVYIALMALDAFLFAPWAMAVERFSVLGERATHFLDQKPTSRLLEFAKLRAILAAIETISYLAISFTVRYGPREFIVAYFAIFALIAWALLRFYILLSAVAVESDGATLKNAHLDAKGKFWLSFLLFAISISPLIVIMVGTPALNLGQNWTVIAKISVFRAGVEVLWIAVANSACAQLYIMHSQALGRPRVFTPNLIKVFD